MGGVTEIMEGIYKQEFYKGKFFIYFFHYKDILPNGLYILPLYKFPNDVHCLEELISKEFTEPRYKGQKEIGYVVIGKYNNSIMNEPLILKH